MFQGDAAMSVQAAGSTAQTGFARAVSAVRRAFAPADHLGLWTLTVDGAVAGALFREGGTYRLALFEGSDPRLAGVEEPITDVPALEQALSDRLAAAGGNGRVRLQLVPA
jgi:hypothetical protein